MYRYTIGIDSRREKKKQLRKNEWKTMRVQRPNYIEYITTIIIKRPIEGLVN